MKRVAIITINDYHNYGNRLQNYATQEVLRSLGFEVETVVNNSIYNPNKVIKLKDRIRKIKNLSNKEKCKLVKAKILIHINKKSNVKRIEAFKAFTTSNILETDYCISDKNIPIDLSDSFDFFITGSDQVWNPMFGHGSPIDFLTFAPKYKRIAYAASFGVSNIPQEYIENFKYWLSEMRTLSVREEAGAKIIKDLTGRHATILVDPTLMLKKEKWLSLSKKAVHKPRNEYLLTYFLGDITNETKKRIKQISLKNNLEVINLTDIKDKNRYYADPSEFIDYINSASIFLTNSFHGVVFSILLEKPFIIFDRIGNMPSMNSRVDTLLSTFNLQSRQWDNITSDDDIFNTDYSHIAKILEFERNKSLEYLKEALQVENESKYES
jgi:hypothetical protein